MKPSLNDPQLTFLVGINITIIALATVWSGGQLLGYDNVQSMASQVPELGFLAMGVMLAMISGNGGIDLSGVALANLAGVTAGLLASQLVSADGSPLMYTALFIVAALLVGIVGGLINGLLVAYGGLTPILATLGTQLLYTGIAVVLTNGSAVRLGYIEPLSAIGNETLAGIPLPLLLLLLVASVLGAILKYSPFGIRLYLMGANQKAARYAGIPLRLMLIKTYTAAGMLAATAGIIIASRTASAKWDYGSSYLLIAILIVVMAGVKPAGGYGRMACLLLSACALQLLSSAFNLIGISNFFRDCAWGFLLMLSLASSGFDFRGMWRRRQ